MKKRAKLIAVASSFCLCLSLLVMGIFAATSVTFSVTSSLSFKANGAFVKVDAELRQGATADGATRQDGAPDTYKYTVYSYNKQASSDLPDGSATLDNFVNADGTEDPSWDIGDIQFTDKLPVVVYHFEYTNYSPVPVVVTTTSDTNISTLQSEMSGTITIVENYSNGNVLAAYTGSSPSTTVYTITVELEKFTTGFSTKALKVGVKFSTDLSSIPDQGEFPTLTFTTKYGGKASVKANSSNKPTGNLIIPSAVMIEGEPYVVTEISSSAFEGCSSLTNVTIPDFVTTIWASAFKYCTLLSTIDLSENLEIIGEQAFRGCTGLTSITIPASVMRIDTLAFYECDSLAEAIIEDPIGWWVKPNSDPPEFADQVTWGTPAQNATSLQDARANPEYGDGYHWSKGMF